MKRKNQIDNTLSVMLLSLKIPLSESREAGKEYNWMYVCDQ